MIGSQQEGSFEEVVSEMLNEGHNRQQLLLSDTVSPLGLAEGTAGICDHSFLAILHLGKHCSIPTWLASVS